jgi:hypothetical protein
MRTVAMLCYVSTFLLAKYYNVYDDDNHIPIVRPAVLEHMLYHIVAVLVLYQACSSSHNNSVASAST